MPPSDCEGPTGARKTPRPQGALHRCRESFSFKAEVILVLTPTAD